MRLCYLSGTDLPQAKLNETLVKRIRAEHQKKERLKKLLDEEHSAAAIAKRYGVNVNTITKVLTYATWRHVRDESSTASAPEAYVGPAHHDAPVQGPRTRI